MSKSFLSGFADSLGSYLGSRSGFVFVLALMAVVYLFKMDIYPAYQPAETGVSAISYRYAEYGDMRNPLVFSDSYNAGEVRYYPPVVAMTLRNWWHNVTGFTATGGRVFSGLLVGGLALLFGLTVFKYSRGDWGMATMALVATGLNPSAVLLARTAGVAQEIVFMGMLAFLFPLLSLDKKDRWPSRLVWVGSGLCAAWAGASGLWGLLFPAALVLSFFICRKSWHEQDGLDIADRLFWVVLGAMPLLTLTLTQVMQDLPKFQEAMKAICDFQKLEGKDLNETFLKFYLLPLSVVMSFYLYITGLNKNMFMSFIKFLQGVCAVFVPVWLTFLAFSPQIAAGIPQDRIYKALAEMTRETGLQGTVYVDASTWRAGGKNILAYTDAIRTGKAVAFGGFVLDPDIFNNVIIRMAPTWEITQADGNTWKDMLSIVLSENVLRAMVVTEGQGKGYYYLMPTGVDNPVLITLFDATGKKHRLRGFYKDAIPFNSVLENRWYLLMSLPGRAYDFSPLRNESSLDVHYTKIGNGLSSVALVKSRGGALGRADSTGRVVMIPLTEGWKE